MKERKKEARKNRKNELNIGIRPLDKEKSNKQRLWLRNKLDKR